MRIIKILLIMIFFLIISIFFYNLTKNITDATKNYYKKYDYINKEIRGK